MLLTIFIIFLLYIWSITLALKLDSYCMKFDPHYDENPLWLIIPFFNILIYLVFLLVILIHRENDKQT